MNCPICGAAMEPGGVKALNIGGLMSARTTLTWYPQAKLEKSGFRGLLCAGGQASGHSGWNGERHSCAGVVLRPLRPGSGPLSHRRLSLL